MISVRCVAAGSLATSVFDSDAVLVGASGGVYALIAAHLPSVFLVSAIFFKFSMSL